MKTLLALLRVFSEKKRNPDHAVPERKKERKKEMRKKERKKERKEERKQALPTFHVPVSLEA